MDHLNFANHLGFSTWEDLLQASDEIVSEPDRRWYVVHTNTWYKWVVWNSHYDFYFHHQSREEALSTMKYLCEKYGINASHWCVPEPYETVHSAFLGSTDVSM